VRREERGRRRGITGGDDSKDSPEARSRDLWVGRRLRGVGFEFGKLNLRISRPPWKSSGVKSTLAVRRNFRENDR